MKLLPLVLFLACAPAAVSAEELVVVVSEKSQIKSLSKDDLINIYMGRTAFVAEGIRAVPADLPLEFDERSVFYRNLIGKSPIEVNAYWARLVFSGKTAPPVQVKNIEELQGLLRKTNELVGYMHPADVAADLRVVYRFEGGGQ